MEKYYDRKQAGEFLSKYLGHYANQSDVIVLGLPRGGVPVAYEVARSLNVPLDVFVVRKLGVPWHEELAMGAIATGNVIVYNQDIIDDLRIPESEIRPVIHAEEAELRRREQKYRGNHIPYDLQNKTVILVDDGIATGATIRAGIKALRKLNAARIVVAVPVAQAELCRTLEKEVDELVCPARPAIFFAVGAWYDHFEQTEDEEVYDLLKKARNHQTTH